MAWVAPVIAIFGLGMTVVASQEEKKANEKAAAEAEEIAAQNARIAQAKTERKIRVRAKELSRKESLAKAATAASGFTGGSNIFYLQEMQSTHQEELDWLSVLGGFDVQQILTEGQFTSDRYQSAADRAEAQGYLAGLDYLGDIASGGQEAGWWGVGDDDDDAPGIPPVYV